MYSLAFPNMFNGATMNLVKDYDAVKSNLRNLLYSNRGGLYGDPHYGTNLKHILFDQSAIEIMRELVKDDIYEAILSYMPQTTIKRDYIEVYVQDTFVSVTIKAENDLGVVSDLLKIELLNTDETEEQINGTR